MKTSKRIIAVLLFVIFAAGQAVAFAPAKVNKLVSSNETVTVNEVESVDAFSVDLAAIDAQFAAAEDITTEAFSMLEAPESVQKVEGEKNAWIAVALAFLPAYVLGISGCHRLYLGGSVGVFIAYLLTCGGCGILNWVDIILLIINNDDISQYVDNSRFFMWTSK